MKPLRQGDVLLVPVGNGSARFGATIRRRRGQGIILASGEATGHHHRMRDPRARHVRLGTREYLIVPDDGGVVTHEEHDPLHVPGGTYEIVRQREHVPPARGQRTQRSQPVWD